MRSHAPIRIASSLLAVALLLGAISCAHGPAGPDSRALRACESLDPFGIEERARVEAQTVQARANAYPVLLHALSLTLRAPESLAESLPRAGDPITRADAAALAAYVHEHGRVLDLLEEASRRPVLHVPLTPRGFPFWGGEDRYVTMLALPVVARWTVRFFEGDAAGAQRDVLTLARITRLLLQQPPSLPDNSAALALFLAPTLEAASRMAAAGYLTPIGQLELRQELAALSVRGALRAALRNEYRRMLVVHDKYVAAGVVERDDPGPDQTCDVLSRAWELAAQDQEGTEAQWEAMERELNEAPVAKYSLGPFHRQRVFRLERTLEETLALLPEDWPEELDPQREHPPGEVQDI